MAFVLSHAPLSVSRCRPLDNEGRGRVNAVLRCCLSPSLGLRPSPTPYLYRRARHRELALHVNATDVYATSPEDPFRFEFRNRGLQSYVRCESSMASRATKEASERRERERAVSPESPARFE